MGEEAVVNVAGGMSPMTAGLISQGISTGTGLLGQWTNYRLNRKLAEYAYSKDLEMWNRQNAYNAPIMQMQRLAEAGLNPNMMYGTGQSANQAKEMPRYNAPTASFDTYVPNILQTIGSFQDIRIKKAQADNFQAMARERNLKNEITIGSLKAQIDKIIADSSNSGTIAAMNQLKYELEKAWAGESVSEKSGQLQEKAMNLASTSETVEAKELDNDMRRIELSIFRSLEKLGEAVGMKPDSDIVGWVSKLIQSLLISRRWK